MAERYTRLYTLPENLYTEGAPLVIAAGALLKDNQTGKVLAQLKYRSICSRPIRAIKVLITGYDMAKAVVCREEHQYLDLEIGRDEYWGSKEAVYLPDRSGAPTLRRCSRSTMPTAAATSPTLSAGSRCRSRQGSTRSSGTRSLQSSTG
ncbi:MAG: hypothetical protein V8S87_04010 [Oscillospiraceae bacterium]